MCTKCGTVNFDFEMNKRAELQASCPMWGDDLYEVIYEETTSGQVYRLSVWTDWNIVGACAGGLYLLDLLQVFCLRHIRS
jgi:hypothetical protein